MADNTHDEKIKFAIQQLVDLRMVIRKERSSKLAVTFINNRIQLLKDQLVVKPWGGTYGGGD